jgi:hypothetical protein
VIVPLQLFETGLPVQSWYPVLDKKGMEERVGRRSRQKLCVRTTLFEEKLGPELGGHHRHHHRPDYHHALSYQSPLSPSMNSGSIMLETQSAMSHLQTTSMSHAQQQAKPSSPGRRITSPSHANVPSVSTRTPKLPRATHTHAGTTTTTMAGHRHHNHHHNQRHQHQPPQSEPRGAPEVAKGSTQLQLSSHSQRSDGGSTHHYHHKEQQPQSQQEQTPRILPRSQGAPTPALPQQNETHSTEIPVPGGSPATCNTVVEKGDVGSTEIPEGVPPGASSSKTLEKDDVGGSGGGHLRSPHQLRQEDDAQLDHTVGKLDLVLKGNVEGSPKQALKPRVGGGGGEAGKLLVARGMDRPVSWSAKLFSRSASKEREPLSPAARRKQQRQQQEVLRPPEESRNGASPNDNTNGSETDISTRPTTMPSKAVEHHNGSGTWECQLAHRMAAVTIQAAYRRHAQLRFRDALVCAVRTNATTATRRNPNPPHPNFTSDDPLRSTAATLALTARWTAAVVLQTHYRRYAQLRRRRNGTPVGRSYSTTTTANAAATVCGNAERTHKPAAEYLNPRHLALGIAATKTQAPTTAATVRGNSVVEDFMVQRWQFDSDAAYEKAKRFPHYHATALTAAEYLALDIAATRMQAEARLWLRRNRWPREKLLAQEQRDVKVHNYLYIYIYIYIYIHIYTYIYI